MTCDRVDAGAENLLNWRRRIGFLERLKVSTVLSGRWHFEESLWKLNRSCHLSEDGLLFACSKRINKTLYAWFIMEGLKEIRGRDPVTSLV